MIVNAVHTLADVYINRDNKKNLLLGLSDAYFGCVFMGSATLVHLISRDGAGVRFLAYAAEEGIGQATQRCTTGSCSIGQQLLQMQTNQMQA